MKERYPSQYATGENITFYHYSVFTDLGSADDYSRAA